MFEKKVVILQSFSAKQRSITLIHIIMISKIRPYILPIAIVLGLLLHTWCRILSPAVPYVIFSILLLTFCAVDLRQLKPSWMDFWIGAWQVVISVVCYYGLTALGVNVILAEGIMMGALCPVASAVAAVSCLLGANRQRVTTFTILGNLLIAFVAPVIFSAIGVHPEMGFWPSVWMILRRIFVVIGMPLVVAAILQVCWPKAKNVLGHQAGASFYLWAIALLFTLGQTIDDIFLHGEGNWMILIWMAVSAMIFCIIQFVVGKWIGKQFGDKIAGGQLLAQKNSAMGIWMANTFLHPLASVFLAFYSIYTNLYNSWQIWDHDRHISKQHAAN